MDILADMKSFLIKEFLSRLYLGLMFNSFNLSSSCMNIVMNCFRDL